MENKSAAPVLLPPQSAPERRVGADAGRQLLIYLINAINAEWREYLVISIIFILGIPIHKFCFRDQRGNACFYIASVNKRERSRIKINGGSTGQIAHTGKCHAGLFLSL